MQNQRGFTIVELMVAMAFIAVLLLAIAGAVMQVGAIYNRGITMKSVNQAGRVVIDDMKRALSESEPLSVEYVPQSPDDSNVIGGRLCTGVYSYIWNIGIHVNDDDPASQVNRYEDAADENKQLRLVKIPDSGSRYCDGDADQRVDASKAVELLSSGGVSTGDSQTITGNLAVQHFHIERLTNNLSTGTALYSIAVVISDADKESINTVDNSCRPPSDNESNQQYCAVNEFIFTAQAGNGGGQ
jgi:prepilin-type N-terminal cleavage/methylation domain-containing protein